MVAWMRNAPITPEEGAAFGRRNGIPRDPEDIVPWGSGNVFHVLGIPDPEDGEDDELGPIGNDFLRGIDKAA